MTMTLPLVKIAGPLILAAAGACPVAPAPVIDVIMAQEPAQIRQDLGKDELKSGQADTNLPYQMRDLSHVETGGMMHGDINVKYDIGTSTVSDCVRYDTVRVTLEIAPVIFIAREYKPGSCWYKQVYEHEQSHVDVDKQVIEKYAARLKDGLVLAFSQPGDAIQGPAKDTEALKKDMGKQVMDITDMLVNDMARERQAKQQGVDSLQGYAYIMNQCYDGANVVRIK